MTVRFLILILAFSIFFLSTSPDDFSLALRQSRIPYEFCFAFTTALRFVPVLATEAQSISDAQRSRGLELEKGKFLKRIKNYIPILIPLIVNSIRRSLELAEAMEARGFGLKKERTTLYTLKLKKPDYAVLCLISISIFILVYIRYFMILPTFL
jgi:energy-coupling factor transport system permease protein